MYHGTHDRGNLQGYIAADPCHHEILTSERELPGILSSQTCPECGLHPVRFWPRGSVEQRQRENALRAEARRRKLAGHARPRTWPSQVIRCRIDETELQGDYGLVPGTEATCLACGHVTESYGTSEGSVRRCLALMRGECPRGSSSYYRAE